MRLQPATQLLPPIVLLVLLFNHCASAQEDLQQVSGERIFAAQCASCHGEQGQGTDDFFSAPLEGDLSVGELAEYISESMPEEDPDLCVSDDANAVARFIHGSFYSEEARFRRKGTRVELQRRTVRQYRESLAELVDSFNRTPFWIPDERGIKANYFAWGEWHNDRKLSEQIDPTIDFPNEKGGVPYFRADNQYKDVKELKRENDMGKGFSVYYRGGLVAPKTGEYEFVVNCQNGFKLFVNDHKKPLIDRWVRSDDTMEHRATVYLLSGRPYNLAVELFSYKDPEVAVQLKWVPPGGSLEVVPESALVPHSPDESIAISAPFPADDASAGYERGISVSRQWDEATTSAAIEAADWIAERIWKLARTKGSAENRKEKVIEFCYQFVERAFIKKLTKDDRRFFVDQHFEKNLSIPDQVKRVVLLTLKSPRFLYPELQERGEQQRRAQQLALLFWDSMPDRRLFKILEKGDLKDQQLHGEVYRLLHDPRAKSKLQDFFGRWLRMDSIADANKDMNQFPEFDEQMLRDLRASLELYLNEVAWSEQSDFRELYLAPYLYTNSRIAKFYQVDSDRVEESNQSFSKIEFEPDQRAGILTHPYLMTGLAYHKDSSPIHRGVFVARSLIGRSLRQPPDDVEPLTEEFAKGLTMRERVEHQTKETSCMNCHRVINPLGFSLENFDAVGRFRTMDKEKPINVATAYETPDGEVISLNGPRELAEFIANDEMAQRSFIRQLFNYYTKQSIAAYGEQTLNELHRSFVENKFSIKELLVEIARVVIK